MKTPRYGSTITNTIQAAFAQPLMSCRRKRSTNTVIRIQIQITQKKKISIDQKTSMKG
jgi:hypothetical protein